MAVVAGNEGGFGSGRASGRQLFGELMDVRRDGGVCNIKDLGGAAIIRFDFVDDRSGVAIGEFKNVLIIGSAPGINALRVIAHHHDVVMPRGEQIDEVALQLVGILIFIHENELKPALVLLADALVLGEQFQPERQQVIEIHCISGAFAFGIEAIQIGDLGGQGLEMLVFLFENCADRFSSIDGKRKDFGQHFGFGKTSAFDINP